MKRQLFAAPKLLVAGAFLAAGTERVLSQDISTPPPVFGTAAGEWKIETVAGRSQIWFLGDRSFPAGTRAAVTGDLISFIKGFNRSPHPSLEGIYLGEWILNHSIQEHLIDKIGEGHSGSLWNAVGKGDVSASPNARPLKEVAVKVLQESPDIKMLGNALGEGGYRIREIVWPDFKASVEDGNIVFRGNPILSITAK